MFYFLCLFFMYLCEKHYKSNIVHQYIADFVSWVPRLALFDLQINWTYEHTLRMELIHMYGTYSVCIY